MPTKDKGGSFTSAKGLYSKKSNPMPNAKMTKPTSGTPFSTPANSDQMKVRSLRAKAFTEKDSLRGKAGT